MSAASTSVTVKSPVNSIRSAQAVQQPQFGSLWTIIGTGFAAAALHAPTSPPITATSPNARTLPTKRSEEHTSELQSLMRISYAVFCLKKKKKQRYYTTTP